MNQKPPDSFIYEHCDVPQGQSLAEWRTSRATPSRRLSQVANGMLAAPGTLAPSAFSRRGSRTAR